MVTQIDMVARGIFLVAGPEPVVFEECDSCTARQKVLEAFARKDLRRRTTLEWLGLQPSR